MEPDIRQETNDKGFCQRHYTKMFSMKNRLGLALMLESHLESLKKEVKTFKPATWPWRASSAEAEGALFNFSACTVVTEPTDGCVGLVKIPRASFLEGLGCNGYTSLWMGLYLLALTGYILQLPNECWQSFLWVSTASSFKLNSLFLQKSLWLWILLKM